MIPLEFSKDDFSCNIPVWEKVLSPLKGRSNLSYLELGTFEGRSLFWMLENILYGDHCHAQVVDRFENGREDIFRSNLKKSGLQNRVRVSKNSFSEELKKVYYSNRKFDVIYEDGSHVASQTLETLMLAWPLLKNDGIFIIDDYRWNEGWLPEFTNKLGIDSFLFCHRQELDIKEIGHQVIVQKKQNAVYGEDQIDLGDWVYHLHDRVFFHRKTSRRISITESENVFLKKCFQRSEFRKASGKTSYMQAVNTCKPLKRFLSALSLKASI